MFVTKRNNSISFFYTLVYFPLPCFSTSLAQSILKAIASTPQLAIDDRGELL